MANSRLQGSRAQSDIAALGCSDGKFRLVSGNGKIEKEVEAHRGAVISLRWSPDGAALVTGAQRSHPRRPRAAGSSPCSSPSGAFPLHFVCVAM